MSQYCFDHAPTVHPVYDFILALLGLFAQQDCLTESIFTNFVAIYAVKKLLHFLYRSFDFSDNECEKGEKQINSFS